MTDLVTALAERLQAVVDDATYADNYKVIVGERLAREALAFVAERLPTREEIEKIICERIECNCGAVDIGVGILHEPRCGERPVEETADALLRDVRGRLGVEQ